MKKLKMLTAAIFTLCGSVYAAECPTIEIIESKIKSTSVTPASAPIGSKIQFSAMLTAPLPTGYNVKMDFGKSPTTMTCLETECTVTRVMTATGKKPYEVGIYDSKNTLIGSTEGGIFNVEVEKVLPKNEPPTLQVSQFQSPTKLKSQFSIVFVPKDTNNNLDSISVDWGDGSLKEIKPVINEKSVTFTHDYKKEGSFKLKAVASDEGIPVLASNEIVKIVEVKKTLPIKYTKVCNNGALAGQKGCPKDPILGKANNEWACTKDNGTGFIWELKTNDGGLRDKNWRYSNGSKSGKVSEYLNCYDDGFCDTSNYVNAVNEIGLCGSSDWRLPSEKELLSIVYCSDGEYRENGECSNWNDRVIENPAIIGAYFPNTPSDWWTWTSSSSSIMNNARTVYFVDGTSTYNDRSSAGEIRLVRGGQ